jgi:hypothetical protein
MIPCLFHCPRGAAKQAFREVVRHHVACAEVPKHPTVDIITYNNTKLRFPIEDQAARLGLRLHVVARDYRPWSWAAKISEPKILMERMKPPKQYVMLVDGNDTIFTRPPYVMEIQSVLEHYANAKILFCPTSADWPPNEACRRFERSLSSSTRPHLSAGAYVGCVNTILEIMEWIEERRLKGLLCFRGRFDDQLAWRQAHLTYYPRLAIDTEGLLFNRFDRMYIARDTADKYIL